MKLALKLRPYTVAVQIAAYTALVWRLYSSGLHRIYRWFFAFVIFEAVRLAVMGSMNLQTNRYAEVYFVTQPITWFLYLAVLLELNRLALRNHPGIATLARRVGLSALVLAAAVLVVSLAVEGIPAPQQSRFIATYVRIERLILSGLLVFLLVLTSFLAYFPVPLNRNLVIHARIFTIFFFVKAIVLVFRNQIAGEMVYTINLAVQGLAIGCLVAWTALLSRAGEDVPTASSHWRNTESEQRVLAQLDAINQTLVGSGRKS